MNSMENHHHKPLVGINCGGRDGKKWPLENFIRLGEILSEKNIPAEYILGPDEENFRKLLLENLPPHCNLLPLIPVADLKEKFRRYSVFVTSDSGPMHVAVAAGVSVVGLFGPGETERFKPWGLNHEVIHLGFSCNPCSENCKFEEPYCIKEITVSHVKKVLFEKLKDSLDSTA